jgi:RNA polymerase sigma-70 factor, ECF subfamily
VSEKEHHEIFEHWLQQYKGLIFKIVKSYADTGADQQDLFQDVVLQVWRSIPSFRNKSAVSTWIYRVSLNTAMTWFRQEKKRDRVDNVELAHHVLDDNTNLVDERLAWLYKEIQQLDKVDRSIALLLLDNLGYKEIASILGISESNVGVKLHRIKKHLITKSKHYEHGI